LKFVAFCFECDKEEELDLDRLKGDILGINHPVVLKCGHRSRPGYIKVVPDER